MMPKQTLSKTFLSDSVITLKADRPHLCNYQHMPTNYRHTDKHLRLVMTLIALSCTRLKPSPKYRLLHARKLTLTFDLDPYF